MGSDLDLIAVVKDTASPFEKGGGMGTAVIYPQIIGKLGVHGVIPSTFANQIRGMAGLRNILVHDYLRVDLEKLIEFVRFRLEDFLVFMKLVREYLAKNC